MFIELNLKKRKFYLNKIEMIQVQVKTFRIKQNVAFYLRYGSLLA